MGKVVDLSLQRFGLWEVISRGENSGSGKARWLCRCGCGTEKLVLGASLTSGKSEMCRSCSASKPVNVERMKVLTKKPKHGMCGTRFYDIWCNMLSRCKDKSNAAYGGRGITVCEEWKEFQNFYEDMFDTYSDDLTIERIDVNGNYSLENCKWASRKEQMNNRTDNRLIEFNGEVKTLTQWSESLGLPYERIKRRLQQGWSAHKAFLSPVLLHKTKEEKAALLQGVV